MQNTLTIEIRNVYILEEPRLTKRAPDAGYSTHIPSNFLRLSIFPVGRRSVVRPNATKSPYGE
jgi:hypothetical protein